MSINSNLSYMIKQNESIYPSKHLENSSNCFSCNSQQLGTARCPHNVILFLSNFLVIKTSDEHSECFLKKHAQ